MEQLILDVISKQVEQKKAIRKSQPGQGPVQPAVGDPALAGGLDQMTHRGPFQPLPFYDSVIHQGEIMSD